MERGLVTYLHTLVLAKKPSDRLFQSTPRVYSALGIRRYTIKISHVLDPKGFCWNRSRYTNAEAIVITRMCPWLRQSLTEKLLKRFWRVGEKMDLVLVRHFKEERLVQNGGCEYKHRGRQMNVGLTEC